jgi:hypothetical protein
MKNIAYWFIGIAALFGLGGMLFGIWMFIANDHSLAGAHAHNNLVGWVTMALYGLYYKAVPSAASGMVAAVHFWVALVGALAFGPGIALVIMGQSTLPVTVGALATALGMAIFAFQAFRHR